MPRTPLYALARATLNKMRSIDRNVSKLIEFCASEKLNLPVFTVFSTITDEQYSNDFAIENRLFIQAQNSIRHTPDCFFLPARVRRNA